jgi:hypothetical protein
MREMTRHEFLAGTVAIIAGLPLTDWLGHETEAAPRAAPLISIGLLLRKML